jgi:hypothetical protein
MGVRNMRRDIRAESIAITSGNSEKLYHGLVLE